MPLPSISEMAVQGEETRIGSPIVQELRSGASPRAVLTQASLYPNREPASPLGRAAAKSNSQARQMAEAASAVPSEYIRASIEASNLWHGLTTASEARQ